MHCFTLTKQWNGHDITDHELKVSVEFKAHPTGLLIEITAPFFNDLAPPGGQAGRPYFQLWDYEVVEVFFLSTSGSSPNRYLELEFGPHGQHLALLLDGDKNRCIKHSMQMEYTAVTDEATQTWRGRAVIPFEFFPPKVDRFNVYAIHQGSSKDPSDRIYEALFKVPGDFPDYHRIDHFGPINVGSKLPGNEEDKLSQLWREALENFAENK